MAITRYGLTGPMTAYPGFTAKAAGAPPVDTNIAASRYRSSFRMTDHIALLLALTGEALCRFVPTLSR